MLLTVLALLVAALQPLPAHAGSPHNYIVLYHDNAVPGDAAAAIATAGGTLVHSYPQIGVAIARSDSVSFRTAALADSRVEDVSTTTGFGSQLRKDNDATAVVAEAPASAANTLASRQWDMAQIKAPEAHAVTPGKSSVLVGDIDTGIDWHHPALKPNIDFGNSVSCVGGTPNQDPNAWLDDDGHGTHTAGTIAATMVGYGMEGVAPGVKIAAIKTSDPDGYFYPEAVVCAFVWAAEHHVDVTNNSYFADPWLYNCRNDPTQHAIWKAEQRAIRYAMQNGVTVVAAAGNENQDLAHPTTDTISPDNGTPQTRTVTNACVEIPVEIPGVIGVSAVGNKQVKSYYSNYGVGVIQVAAPGGDRRYQRTAAASNGRVLSTWPSYAYNPNSPLQLQDCSVSPCATYAYLQGTSMASPHVAGVAALIVSQYGKLPTGKVQSLVTSTADAIACPPNPYDPGGAGAWTATCQGGSGKNSFYGSGQVNALSAVTHGH